MKETKEQFKARLEEMSTEELIEEMEKLSLNITYRDIPSLEEQLADL